MVTKSDTPLSTEAPEIKTESTLPESQTETPEPDWKAEATSAKAELAKLQNDLKALKGAQAKSVNRDAKMDAIEDRITEMAATNKALFKALAEGNPENLPQEAARIANESAQTRTTRNFQTQYANLRTQLDEAVLDDDGKAVLDLTTSPELADDRAAFAQLQTDYSAGKVTGAEVLAELARITAKAGRLANKKMMADKLKAAEKKGEAKGDKKLKEKGGVLDMDDGPGASAPSPKSYEQLSKVDTRTLNPKQRREHKEALEAAINRKR